MPLFCISFFTFLLLPLCLSCDSKRPLLEVVRQYMATVRIDLLNTRENITPMLQNVSCRAPKHKLRNCTSNNTDFVTGLHSLTCKMKNLNVAVTNRLTRSVLGSLQCPCSIKPSKEPDTRLKKRMTTRWRRNEQRERRREIRKLCKAQLILSAMTECYQMLLNAMLT